MTNEPTSPNSVETANNRSSFAQRNWQQIVWLIAAIIGIIAIISLFSRINYPSSQNTQFVNVFFVVYVVGLVRSQFRYRIRGATFGSLHADEQNKKQRMRREDLSPVFIGAKIPFFDAIVRWIQSKILWFLFSGVTWPFIEAYVQLRYLISSGARRAKGN